MQPISDQQKSELWQAYAQRRPTRVPVRLSTNPRILLLNPQLNPEGITFAQAAADPRTHIEVALRYQLYLRTVLNHFTDSPTTLPQVWEIGLAVYNVYEAALLGAQVRYPTGQVPCTEPFLTDANKHDVFQQDIEHPLDHPFAQRHLQMWREMEQICRELRFEGRPVRLLPWAPAGTDGPLTVGCNLRGADFLVDLLEDPGYADRLMAFIIRAAICRRQAFAHYWGNRLSRWNGMADDSIAMLSTDMVAQRLVPLYRTLYQATEQSDPSPMPRSIHLCGDATRHFPLLRRELGISSFDTGFPVNHGALRKALGPEVEISGGPEVALLLAGSPNQVYQRTQSILLSGIKEGGRFILQEGNNLPPSCPPENLQALYTAAQDHGRYDH